MKIDNKWFFSEPGPLLRLIFIFVKGDMIVLIPLFCLILLSYLISLKFMLIMIGVYIAARHFFEVIYWLLQQFGDHKYRPYDYGLKNLDNNAIYILYQLLATAQFIIGIGIIAYVLLNL